jgi:CRP/FNR family transcriptional regulator, nitrogen oxide reductase regulator
VRSAAVEAASKPGRFLEGLSSTELSAILGAGTERRFSTGCVICNPGAPAEQFFLLKSGRARHFVLTPEGRKVLLRWLGPGSIFGAATVLSRDSTFIVGTEVVKDSRVHMWHRAAIRKLVWEYRKLMDNLLWLASDYLIWYTAAHVALVSQDARQRLADVLVTLSTNLGHVTEKGTELEITNEELANTANVTPFTASRLLSEWHRTGALKKTRRRILLRAPERLF